MRSSRFLWSIVVVIINVHFIDATQNKRGPKPYSETTKKDIACMAETCNHPVFARPREMQEHFYNQHLGRKYVCKAESCGFAATNVLEIKRHVTNQHDKGFFKVEYQCQPCNKTVLTFEEALKHFKEGGHDLQARDECEEKRTHPCQFPGCTRMFADYAAVHYPLHTDHWGRVYVCQRCKNWNARTRALSSIKKHIDSHMVQRLLHMEAALVLANIPEEGLYQESFQASEVQEIGNKGKERMYKEYYLCLECHPCHGDAELTEQDFFSHRAVLARHYREVHGNNVYELLLQRAHLVRIHTSTVEK